jgi:hypothetical protein
MMNLCNKKKNPEKNSTDEHKCAVKLPLKRKTAGEINLRQIFFSQQI